MIQELSVYKCLTIVNLSQNLKLLCCLFCLSILAHSSIAQFRLEKRGKTELIEFKFIKNLIIFPLYINSKGPFNFILDTGVGILLLTDPLLKDSLHLHTSRNITITGFGEGRDVKAGITSELNIKINNVISGNIQAAILEKDAFDLSSYTGMPVHGILGFEFFNSFIVGINYEAKTIKVYKPETWYIPKKGFAVPIIIEVFKPYVQCTISPNGKVLEGKMLIDTGSGHPVWLEKHDNKPIEPPEKNINANLGVGLNGDIYGRIARLKGIKLSKYDIKDIVAAFPDTGESNSKVLVDRVGSIGTPLLKRFNVVFDYSRETMYLKPNSMFKQPFEHDMSGIEIAFYPPEYKRAYVARVEPRSAAEDCGLQINDEILSINFKPINEWNLEDLYELFHSKEGRGIALTIAAPNAKKVELVVLTLKKRI